MQRGFVLGLGLFFCQIPCCFAGTLFLSRSFIRYSFLKLGRARISHMRFIFLDNALSWLFLISNSNFVPGASWEFYGVSAEAFNLVCPAFRRIDFFGLDLFFFQSRNCSLRTLLLRLLAGFLLTINMSIQSITAISAPVFRLVIPTHGRVSKITSRSLSFSRRPSRLKVLTVSCTHVVSQIRPPQWLSHVVLFACWTLHPARCSPISAVNGGLFPLLDAFKTLSNWMISS